MHICDIAIGRSKGNMASGARGQEVSLFSFSRRLTIAERYYNRTNAITYTLERPLFRIHPSEQAGEQKLFRGD